MRLESELAERNTRGCASTEAQRREGQGFIAPVCRWEELPTLLKRRLRAAQRSRKHLASRAGCWKRKGVLLLFMEHLFIEHEKEIKMNAAKPKGKRQKEPKGSRTKSEKKNQTAAVSHLL